MTEFVVYFGFKGDPDNPNKHEAAIAESIVGGTVVHLSGYCVSFDSIEDAQRAAKELTERVDSLMAISIVKEELLLKQ